LKKYLFLGLDNYERLIEMMSVFVGFKRPFNLAG